MVLFQIDLKKKPTEHAGVLIGKTLDGILSGKISTYAIDTIKVENPNGEYISADISKKSDDWGECTLIPVTIVDEIIFKMRSRSYYLSERGPGGYLWRTWIESSVAT